MESNPYERILIVDSVFFSCSVRVFFIIAFSDLVSEVRSVPGNGCALRQGMLEWKEGTMRWLCGVHVIDRRIDKTFSM